jgi:hypothetical protein
LDKVPRIACPQGRFQTRRNQAGPHPEAFPEKGTQLFGYLFAPERCHRGQAWAGLLAAGKLATQKRQAYLVDDQIPTDPNNQRVVAGVRAGEIGKIAKLSTFAIGSGGITRGFSIFRVP